LRSFAVAVLILFLAVVTSGCAGTLKAKGMAAPVASSSNYFEDEDLKIGMDIVDNSKVVMDILNKTGGPIRLTWCNSTFATAYGKDEKLAYRVVSGGADDKNGITTLNGGKSAVFEVYPAPNAVKDKDGKETIYPLYYEGKVKGEPSFVNGKTVGVNLVLEIKDHTRMYNLRLRVERKITG